MAVAALVAGVAVVLATGLAAIAGLVAVLVGATAGFAGLLAVLAVLTGFGVGLTGGLVATELGRGRAAGVVGAFRRRVLPAWRSFGSFRPLREIRRSIEMP